MAPKKCLERERRSQAEHQAQRRRKDGEQIGAFDFHLLGLVEEKLLQPREVVQWRKSLGDAPPREGPQETVAFQSHILRGFGVPTPDFFRGLLYHWRIQAHHLTPNSILHILIVVHLCEAYMGIESHFDLFQHLFYLKPQPSAIVIDVVGKAGGVRG